MPVKPFLRAFDTFSTRSRSMRGSLRTQILPATAPYRVGILDLGETNSVCSTYIKLIDFIINLYYV